MDAGATADSGTDAPIDAPIGGDAPVDAPIDGGATADSGTDAPIDGGTGATADASADAPVDTRLAGGDAAPSDPTASVPNAGVADAGISGDGTDSGSVGATDSTDGQGLSDSDPTSVGAAIPGSSPDCRLLATARRDLPRLTPPPLCSLRTARLMTPAAQSPFLATAQP